MKITLHKILFINLLIVQIILAGQGSAGAKFLQINATTRGSANGGTLVARPGLIDALSYNPATAATLTGANSIIHHSDYFVGMSFDYMSFAYNMPAIGTISMGLLGLLSGDIEETTELEPLGTGRTFTANDFAGFLSFARSMTDKFSGGGTIKYVMQNIDKLTASGIVFDMGAIYKVGLFHDLTIGFSIRNFGGDMNYEGENLQEKIKLSDNIFEEEDVRIEVVSDKYSLPISFDLGSSVTIPVRGKDKLISSVAVHNIADQAEFLSIGLEYNLGELMYFVLGHGNLNGMFNNNATELELNGNMRGFTGGFGVNLRPVFNTRSWLSYSFEDHKYFAPIHSFEITLTF
jgi:hypothetical protein|tara:strand:+ start:314 stop:1354 length:1041 start_codon:yes stop_codon:yes gene_type:complete